jgi:hypothetical protein
MSFVEIAVLHILLSFEGILGLLIVYQFHKGGNCKLQGGLSFSLENLAWA